MALDTLYSRRIFARAVIDPVQNIGKRGVECTYRQNPLGCERGYIRKKQKQIKSIIVHVKSIYNYNV